MLHEGSEMMSAMSQAVSSCEIHGVFAARCAQLGIPCWKLEVASGALTEPHEPAAIVPLLQSPSLRSMVQTAASAMAQADAPETVTPLPGWTLAPFTTNCGTDNVLTIALIFGPGFYETPQFNMAY